MQDGVHSSALQVQVHKNEAGELRRRQAGTAFADLLSAVKARGWNGHEVEIMYELAVCSDGMTEANFVYIL